MNKYKKINTDWNAKLSHVIQNKENNYENKMNDNLEKLEKKHSKDRKLITDPNSSRIGENLNNKLDKISLKNELKREVPFLSLYYIFI